MSNYGLKINKNEKTKIHKLMISISVKRISLIQSILRAKKYFFFSNGQTFLNLSNILKKMQNNSRRYYMIKGSSKIKLKENQNKGAQFSQNIKKRIVSFHNSHFQGQSDQTSLLNSISKTNAQQNLLFSVKLSQKYDPQILSYFNTVFSKKDHSVWQQNKFNPNAHFIRQSQKDVLSRNRQVTLKSKQVQSAIQIRNQDSAKIIQFQRPQLKLLEQKPIDKSKQKIYYKSSSQSENKSWTSNHSIYEKNKKLLVSKGLQKKIEHPKIAKSILKQTTFHKRKSVSLQNNNNSKAASLPNNVIKIGMYLKQKMQNNQVKKAVIIKQSRTQSQHTQNLNSQNYINQQSRQFRKLEVPQKKTTLKILSNYNSLIKKSHLNQFNIALRNSKQEQLNIVKAGRKDAIVYVIRL